MFGDQIKKLRISYNYSQVQLSQLMNVSKQTISNWENNNILPSVDMLIRIADLFSVSTDFLLERDHHRYLDTTGLTDNQLAHLNFIIQDILKE